VGGGYAYGYICNPQEAPNWAFAAASSGTVASQLRPSKVRHVIRVSELQGVGIVVDVSLRTSLKGEFIREGGFACLPMRKIRDESCANSGSTRFALCILAPPGTFRKSRFVHWLKWSDNFASTLPKNQEV